MGKEWRANPPRKYTNRRGSDTVTRRPALGRASLDGMLDLVGQQPQALSGTRGTALRAAGWLVADTDEPGAEVSTRRRRSFIPGRPAFTEYGRFALLPNEQVGYRTGGCPLVRSCGSCGCRLPWCHVVPGEGPETEHGAGGRERGAGDTREVKRRPRESRELTGAVESPGIQLEQAGAKGNGREAKARGAMRCQDGD